MFVHCFVERSEKKISLFSQCLFRGRADRTTKEQCSEKRAIQERNIKNKTNIKSVRYLIDLFHSMQWFMSIVKVDAVQNSTHIESLCPVSVFHLFIFIFLMLSTIIYCVFFRLFVSSSSQRSCSTAFWAMIVLLLSILSIWLVLAVKWDHLTQFHLYLVQCHLIGSRCKYYIFSRPRSSTFKVENCIAYEHVGN